MREMRHLALLCAVVIIGLLIPSAMAVETAPGEDLYCRFDKAQERPDIDGDIIVWEDGRNGNKDIYLGEVSKFRADPGLSTLNPSYVGEQITDHSASQEKPSISGDYIVWQDDRSGDWDIYLYRRSTKESVPLTGDSGDNWMPIVHGNYAAWYHDDNSKTEIVLYDITKDVKTTIDCDAKTTIPWVDTTEFRPALSDGYVAWVESGEESVKFYEIGTGTIGYVSQNNAIQSWPSLHGSMIAWEDYRNEGANIYMTDLRDPSRGVQRITSDPSGQVSPAISESIIAWEDTRDGPRSIYMYDISRRKEMSVFVPATNDDEQLYPVVSANTIAWQRGRGDDSNLYVFVYDPSGVTAPILKSIEITPSGATIGIDGTEKFTATALDQFGVEMTDGVEITWSSSDAAVGTIDQAGLFTALAAGTTTITAESGDITATATVTVSAEDPVLTSIEITPSGATIGIDGTEVFTATALDQFGVEMTDGVEITWSSSDESVGTIDQTGLFTALAAGTTTITAESGDITATVTVTVSAEDPVLTSIEITPPGATIGIDGTEVFTATALDQFGVEMTDGVEITWSSSDESVGTIDQTGLFTALAAGTTTITAKSGEITTTATVTVSAEDLVITSIKVKPSTATLVVDDSLRFTATALDQNNNGMPVGEVIWTSSDTAVGTIDADGIFTALAEGSVTITATSGDVAGTATVTVIAEESAFGMIVISPSEVTLGAGDALGFDAITFDPFGARVLCAEVDWTVSDPCVGIIDECGTFTALKAGTVTVCAVGDGATGTATVTVTCADPTLARIVITPPAITLNTGDEATLTAIAFDQYGDELPGADVIWESSDEDVGTIDSDGYFTALEEGTTTITASAGCCGIAGTATMTVTSAPTGLTDGVTITPSEVTLDISDTWEFDAIAFGSEGDVIDDAEVIWSCDDESIGEIDEDGAFRALAAGTVTITASVEEASGTAEVTVRSADPALARIVVSPSDFFIAAGQSLKLSATTFDQYGDELWDVEVHWDSSSPCIGTINDCGVFTAECDGEVILTASAGELSGSACVTVEPSIAVPTSIEVDPSTATIAVGETLRFTAVVFDQCDDAMDWVRVAWSCSDASIGTIDAVGHFTALTEGTTDLTARAGCIEETVAVTVTADPVPDPSPDPTQGNSGRSTSYDSGGGDTGPTFSIGMHEDLRRGEVFTLSDISLTSVSSVTITAADTIPRLMVTVKETACPRAASPPADDIYEYIEICLNWADQRRIGHAEVTFTVSADWLDDHGIVPEEIRLMRYVDGAWQSLETEFIDEVSGGYRFRAITPGFSTFAIAAAGTENVSATTEATNSPTEKETNVTETVTAETTTVATTAPAATTPAEAPLIYAPLLAPLAFLLWPRKRA
jgi:PGF-pre-PGF domain-containing protein